MKPGKQLLFAALIVSGLISGSWVNPLSELPEREAADDTDSIKMDLSCPLVLDIGTVLKDTLVWVDCVVTNRDTLPLGINFSEGYGFRVPQYTRLIEPGVSGKIKFSQAINTPGKFTKSWNFELTNGHKKQILSFVIKGELRK